MNAILEASSALPTAAWLLEDHSFASINGTTIESAIADLTHYLDPAAVNRARKLAESLSDTIRPDEKLSVVNLAALFFVSQTMIALTDSVAELDAEIEAHEFRMECRNQKRAT